METEDYSKKTLIVQPETFVFQTSNKPPNPDSCEISFPSPMRNGFSTPLSSAQDLVLISKVDSSPSTSESDPNPVSNGMSVPSPSPLTSAPYQVPIILNGLPGSNQANNVVTLLQSHHSIPNPSNQQPQIVLDVGSNSIGHAQQLGATGLNGVIPIQFNLSPTQQSQHQPQVIYSSQQLQLINSVSKSPLYRPTQTQIPVPNNPVPIILSHNGETPSNPASASCPPNIVPRVMETMTNGQNGTSPLTFQVQYQQPVSTQTKHPIVTPVIQQTKMDQEPQLVHKEAAQITIANGHPLLNYSQFPPTITHAPKTVMTSNGICQVENLQLAPNTWLKETTADVHAIPIINPALGTHFGLDSFEIGQRRRKKRAVFAPQARRALEQSFEQNTRPSRRELEYLAGKLGLLFEEVRVWFCNKRQKERQQMQLNDQSQCDTPSESYNSLVDCTSPTFQSQTMEEEPAKILEFQVKEECESPGKLILVPGVSDSSHPLLKEILLPDPFEADYKGCSAEPSISAFVQDSIA